MTPMPAFFHRMGLADDTATLAEGEGFLVYRKDGIPIIDWSGPYRPEFEEVYRRNDVKGVCINQTISWGGCSLDFLKHLPNLRSLHIGVDVPMNLSILEELGSLETLGLNWSVPGNTHPGKLDFRRLGSLKEGLISWNNDFSSILECKTLRTLFISDALKIDEFDFTELPLLTELGLRNCLVLERIELNRAANLLALELTNCGKLRPTWARIAPELRYLCVRGRIGFEPEEILAAKDLRYFWLEPSGKQPWEVLRLLPHLEGIRLDGLGAAKSLASLVRSMNETRGHGATRSAIPSKFTLPDEL